MGSLFCCVNKEEDKIYFPPEKRMLEHEVIDVPEKLCKPVKYRKDSVHFKNSYEEISLK